MMKVKSFIGSRLKTYSARQENSEKEYLRSLTCKLSVNEEYKEAFRTNSYLEIRTKAGDQLGLTFSSKLSSPSSSDLSFHSHFTHYLLDPPQETLDALMQDTSFHYLLVKFFDFSSEGCDVCESLLQCIQQIKINHMKVKRVIKIGKKVCNGAKTPEYSPEKLCALIFQELSRYAVLKNPLYCIINEAQFPRVNDANSDLLARLKSKRRRIRRKISILGVLAAPALLGLCCLLRKKKTKRKMENNTKLEKLGAQMDIAAKGTFIMMNDLDTLSRLAGRLCDEIEHRKAVAAMCAKSGKVEVLKEALRVFNGHEERFSELLQELEEHLYLCFHTINISRRLVLAQTTGPSS
ncbi:hypothetical protein DY000_02047080 [Brassica cretica]|uniref:Uncharacterized protein n=1 Tax=Brassica cretica TaxID=69181 RepID=A0ABQ7F7J9_BRACR|nr:hypothetical protein DY000_02047080 [Brassica cretica]